MIKVEDIYGVTNSGLDIILYYYPQAQKALEKKEAFKIRDEKTPSASIKQIKGVWRVTDFGDDAVSRSPIDVVMHEENVTFTEAIYKLAARYGIEKGLSAEINKPIFENREATENEKEGEFLFEMNEKFTEFELSIWGPRVKEEHLTKYNYYSLKWYSTTKDRKTTVIKSTEHYPIFMRDCGEFKKIYQPLNPDKSRRFFYKGTKPAEYINGLTQLEKEYHDFSKIQQKEFESDSKNADKDFKPKKLDECIICSGERDAINAYSFGYFPLWFNSESYRLSEHEYRTICKYVEKVYNIPDIDPTGVKKGIELGMKFIDIYTVWLPEWLSTYKDMRGKPRKDLRDFIELRQRIQDFKNLLKVAMPMRFWEFKLFDKGYRYEVNTEYAYHFLRCNGFGTLENKNIKNGHSFVYVNNHIVKEIKPKDIRAYLREFLENRYVEIEIRNLINNTTRLSESSLENLKELKIDFSDFDRQKQYFFFENKTWEVTAHDVKEYRPIDINRYVWDEEVIKCNVKRIPESFLITQEYENYDITVQHTQSKYFSFLINASRVHWRKEYEENIDNYEAGKEDYMQKHKFDIAGTLLSNEEQFEQKQHLINKIFTLGYLLHRYKDPHRAWCIFAMDNKIGELGDSNGRSGKSFSYKALRKFMKGETLSGRNPKLTENPHIYDRISEHTDLVIVDDSHEYLDFNFFFDVVTGDMPVNPKNNQSYEIPFEKAPKFVITSNYTLRKIDPSTEGRILYSVFSDYYHQKTEDNDYKETRSIFDDFGKNLMMDDYTEEEWNADFNFFADCCKFYLSTVTANSCVKIQPPMNNVTQRNLNTMMGDVFHNWAIVYFSPESDHVDCMIPKEKALKAFVETANVKNWTTQRFTTAIKAFCKRHADYIKRLDPAEFKNNQGRIIRKVEGTSYEMIYVQTKNEIDASHIRQAIDEDLKPL
jgi:hypothetical protein